MRRTAALVLVLAALGCAMARPPRSPVTAEAHNDLGVACFERGDLRRALAEFERAAALRPDWTRALVNLGDARLGLGDVSGAIEAYRRAVASAPDDAGAANNLAWALLQDPARWPEAESIIDGALARHPEPRGYYLDTLGALRLRKGDNQGALSAFREALADEGLREGGARALVLEHAAEALARLGDRAASARCRTLAEAERGRSGSALAATRGAASSVGGQGSVC
ncbi:MAG TPA: tetratricopeptide repeat protein [Methylomirabilota bacterium]